MSSRTHASGDATWTKAVTGRLRALWADGHSTAEIGRRLGLSKNAVVGKAHRLQLPGRESPIRGDPGVMRRVPAPRVPTPRVAARTPTLPPLPAQHERRQPVLAGKDQMQVAVERRTAPPRARGNQPCCWPIGEPNQPGFRFCEGLAEQGGPYCPAHADRAYVRPRRAS